MSVLFLRVVNLAIAAGWLVLAVLVLRLLLKKAPKWTRLLLWAVVALRLLCPVSVETVWSLLPSAETVPLDIERAAAPAIASGVEAVDRVINPALQQSFAPDPAASANPLQIWIPVLSLLWLAGAAALLLYAALSYLRLRRRVATAVRLRDNIYQSEQIPAPFVLGLARPRIYVPFGLSDRDLKYVLAHERAHIARRDHWWKLLGFLLLSVYWFQPLLWLAYVLLGRDLELACDERVIQSLDREHRADYTQALVRCSVSRRTVAACPLTFGEVGVKARVKAVLHYKKPTVWVLMVAVLAAIAAAVCFLTGPKTARTFPLTGTNAADLDPAAIVARTAEIVGLEDGGSLYMGQDQFDQYFDADFNWDADAAIRFFYNQGQQTLGSQLRLYREDGVSFVTEPTAWEAQPVVYLLYDYLKALQCLPQAEIREMAPADRYLVTFQHGGAPEDYDRVLTYTADGPGELDGWYIHLRLEPLHAAEGIYTGTGDEVIHLFYGERYAAVPPEGKSPLEPSLDPEPVPAEPEAELPYTLRSERSDVAVFDGPGYDYGYAATITEPGIYTIVAEQRDSEGSRWGQLKSGLGWIDLAAARESPETQPPVVLSLADPSQMGTGAYQEYVAEQSDYTTYLLFTAAETLREVSLSQVIFDGSGETLSPLCTVEELTPDRPFMAGVVFYGDLTTYVLSFTDEAGVRQQYAARLSGRNGAPVLSLYP